MVTRGPRPENLVTQREGTRVVNFRPAGPFTPTPTITTTNDGPVPTDNGASGRLTQPAALRMFTVDRTNGPVPVTLGGPLPMGGFFTFRPTKHAGYTYFGIGFGEGEISSLYDLKLANRLAVDDLGLIAGTNFNIHLGATGDLTDALISEAEPAYTRPEGVVEVCFKLPPGLGINPFQVTATMKGVLCRDPRAPADPPVWTRNPACGVYESYLNTRWGFGDVLEDMHDVDWPAMANACDVDLGGFKRWEWSIHCDTQNEFGAWLDVFKTHFAAYFYKSGRKNRGFCDLARDTSGLTFKDYGATENVKNLIQECQVYERGIKERPTVVVLGYTNEELEFKDDVTEFPKDLVGDRVERRVSCPGTTDLKRADLAAEYFYKLFNVPYEITTRALMSGLKLEPGLRVTLDSLDLDETPLDATVTDYSFNRGAFDVSLLPYDPARYEQVIPLSETVLGDADQLEQHGFATDGEDWSDVWGGIATYHAETTDIAQAEAGVLDGGGAGVEYKISRSLLRFNTLDLLPVGATPVGMVVTVKVTARAGSSTVLHVGTRGNVVADRPYSATDYDLIKPSVSLCQATIGSSDVGERKIFILSPASLAELNLAGYTYLSLRLDQDYHNNPLVSPPYDLCSVTLEPTTQDRAELIVYYTV